MSNYNSKQRLNMGRKNLEQTCECFALNAFYLRPERRGFMASLGMLCLWVVLLILSMSTMLQAQTLSFPTAEGFGRHASGGRRGRVIYVTNLSDDLPAPAGSFRACVENTGPRTCIFQVGGTINLVEHINLYAGRGDLTIAGQTALGQGINITPWPVNINYGAQNMIIRHLSHRQGFPSVPPSFNNDCAGFLIWGDTQDGEGPYRVSNIILDHVSTGYACDDSFQLYGMVDGTTIQWSIVADPYQGEPAQGFPGPDAYGESKMLIAGSTTVTNNFFTLHHNYAAHVFSRAPNVASVDVFDFRNNIVYLAQHFSGGVDFGVTNNFAYTSFPLNINFVGNKYLYPASVDPGCCRLGDVHPFTVTKIYTQDNQTPFCPGAPNCASDEWDLGWRESQTNDNPPLQSQYRSFSPFPAPPVTMTPVANLESVLTGPNGAGATKPQRDSLDQRVIDELINRTGGVGRGGAPFPFIPSEFTVPLDRIDTDGDGLPDQWEDANGLNKFSDTDGPTIIGSGPNAGYSNLEVWLNYMAGDTAGPTVTNPVVTITFPTTSSTHNTNSTPLASVAGSATDADGSVVSVSWSCPLCTPSSGTATGTTSWSFGPVGLAPGPNTNMFQVIATDNTGLTGQDQLTVTYTPTPPVGNANPVYVNKAIGLDTHNCIVAENPLTPKLTIASGMGCMTFPKKVLRIMPGVYDEVVDTLLTPIQGGDTTEYTRIEGVGSGVVVRELWLRGTLSYVEFANLTFDSANRANRNTTSLYDGASFIRFTNNRFQNTIGGYECIFHAEADGVEYRNNIFTNCAFDGMTVQGNVQGLIVSGNSFSNIEQMAIRGTLTNALIEKNTISSTGTADSTAPAIGLGAGTGALVSNNVIYGNKHGVRVYAGAQNIKIYNNTVASNIPGVGIHCESGASGVFIANNISFGNTTDAIGNACGATETSNRITNPLFVNPGAGDFLLQPLSPAINGATTLTEITDDRRNIQRPQGVAPDQGAYEMVLTVPPGSTFQMNWLFQ